MKRFVWLLVFISMVFMGCTQKAPVSKEISGIQEAQEASVEIEAEQNRETAEQQEPVTSEPKIYKATLAAVGDIMMHKWQLWGAYDQQTDTYDFYPSFEPIQEFIQRADIAIGNLETTFGGAARGYSGYPRFNTPDALADALKKTGFDILTTANNHSLDSNAEGLLRTIEVLDQYGIHHVGTYSAQELRDTIWMEQANNIDFAFLSYTYGTNGLPIPKDHPYMVNLIDMELIRGDIQKAKALDPDFVVIGIHFGNEYQLYPDYRQKQIVDELFAAGADIILGSHPHVIQPMEVRQIQNEDGTIRNGFVIYSMGNFISSQRTTPRDAGIIVNLHFEKEENRKAELKMVDFVPTWVQFSKKNGKEYIRILSTSKALQDVEQGLEKDLKPQEINRIKQVQKETVSHIVYGGGEWDQHSVKFYMAPDKNSY